MARKRTKPAISGIGPKLRELREESGLSQAELSERADLPIGTLRNWEQGRGDPAWDGLIRLVDCFAAVLKVEPRKVLGRLYVEPEERGPLPALPMGRPSIPRE